MGYEHRACKAVCGSCGQGVWWSWEGARKSPTEWKCTDCDSRNVLRRPPQWPHVPDALYIGHDKQRQMKVYPVPPDDAEGTYARPYSTRSFMSQASKRLGGCAYWTRVTGTVMGQPVFSDRCGDASEENGHECHMLAGFGMSVALQLQVARTEPADSAASF